MHFPITTEHPLTGFSYIAHPEITTITAANLIFRKSLGYNPLSFSIELTRKLHFLNVAIVRFIILSLSDENRISARLALTAITVWLSRLPSHP